LRLPNCDSPNTNVNMNDRNVSIKSPYLSKIRNEKENGMFSFIRFRIIRIIRFKRNKLDYDLKFTLTLEYYCEVFEA